MARENLLDAFLVFLREQAVAMPIPSPTERGMSPERVEVGRSRSNGARPRTESKRVSSILVGSSSNPLWSQLESRASDVGRSGSDPYMEGDLVRGAPRSWIASSKVRRHRPMHVPVHRRRLDHRRRRRPRPCRAGRRLSSRQKRMARCKSSLPACAAFVLLARFTSPVGAPEAISTTDWLHDSRILMGDASSTWGGGGGR